jgi:hypothetical protein
LDEAAAAPIHAGAEPLLVEGGDGDAEEAENAEPDAAEMRGIERQLVPQHEEEAGEAEREAEPLARRHALAQERADHDDGQDRLQANDERGNASGDAGGDAGVDATQIERLQQDADHRDVAGGGPIRRPGGPRRQRDQQRQRCGDGEADLEEGEGLGKGDAELGDDEAARPQEDEKGGHREMPKRRDGDGAIGSGHGALEGRRHPSGHRP